MGVVVVIVVLLTLLILMMLGNLRTARGSRRQSTKGGGVGRDLECLKWVDIRVRSTIVTADGNVSEVHFELDRE